MGNVRSHLTARIETETRQSPNCFGISLSPCRDGNSENRAWINVETTENCPFEPCLINHNDQRIKLGSGLNRGMPKLLWLQVEKNQASLVETKENPKKRPCLLGKSQETPILYWREPRKAKETWLFHQRNTLANAIP